jgi:ATP-dependent DNA helicase RecG
MLDHAMDWARRTFGTSIVSAPDGSVHDRHDYPLVAFRELIANALGHQAAEPAAPVHVAEVQARPPHPYTAGD